MPTKGMKQFKERYVYDIDDNTFFGFPKESIKEAEDRLLNTDNRSVAYFSMEYGLAPSIYHQFQDSMPTSQVNRFTEHRVFSNLRAMDSYHQIHVDKILDIPIYSGGLGVLAGDTLKSAADLKLSVVGVGILWNKGYFKQNFWFESGQMPDELGWDPYTYPGLVPTDNIVSLQLGEHDISLRIWKYYVYSYDQKHVIPLILLDSNIEENGDEDDFRRSLTDQLYRSDNPWWKIVQRTILGVGGMRALEALGYSLDLYHMNEGHAALAYAEKAKDASEKERVEIKKRFAYTCHTPVEAGHDRFGVEDIENVFSGNMLDIIKKEGSDPKHDGVINLTQLAMSSSSFVNAVAKKHGDVTRLQFPHFEEKIDSITNGVHSFTWLSDSFSELFKKYSSDLGDWEQDPTLLENVEKLRGNADFRRDIWLAHQENKQGLSDVLHNWFFEPNVFTIAWARRIANYKRPSLILQDVEKIIEIAKEKGPIQIIFAGKAHPNDNLGFTFINEMLKRIDSLAPHRDYIKIFMLENYDTFFGKLLTSSVDVWLNNPLPPFEASGTSGMKAIHNGVLQLSTVDGWIVEARDANIGRFFGYEPAEGVIGTEEDLHLEDDSQKLYDTLSELISIYYNGFGEGRQDFNSEWVDMMINCIKQSGFFNTHRMVREYNQKVWNAE